MFPWIQAKETEETAAENGGDGGTSIPMEFDDGDQRRDEGRAGIH